MAKRKTVTRYRDRDTGRFVGKATWKRSRARGGTRYTRATYRKRPKRKAKREIPATRPRALPEPELTEEEIEKLIEEEEGPEWGGAVDSP